MFHSFYGRYLKCQSDTQTLAVIPAIHNTGNKRTCSIQVITDEDAWTVMFPEDEFQRTKRNIFIGKNRFGEKGIDLAIHTPQVTVKGRLDFGPLSPLKYDIMGPFVLVPFMECRHSVWSMRHLVSGNVLINGQKYCFRNAWGYWEGDRGRSFPKEYAWTQCCFPGGALMLSVADIPMAGFLFCRLNVGNAVCGVYILHQCLRELCESFRFFFLLDVYRMAFIVLCIAFHYIKSHNVFSVFIIENGISFFGLDHAQVIFSQMNGFAIA